MTIQLNNYKECACVKCGWRDGFHEEYIKYTKIIEGFCDVCEDDSIFALIRNQNASNGKERNQNEL